MKRSTVPVRPSAVGSTYNGQLSKNNDSEPPLLDESLPPQAARNAGSERPRAPSAPERAKNWRRVIWFFGVGVDMFIPLCVDVFLKC